MADSDLGVKVSLIPDLNPAEFQAKVNSMKLKVKVTADFTGLSESSKAIGTTSQSLSKMYDKLAKLRKSQLVDKRSVTNAEKQLDLLQKTSRASQDYAKQFAAAQKAVQRAVSKNQNSKTFTNNQIKKAQKDVQKWSQSLQEAFSGKKLNASMFDSFKSQVNQFNQLTAGTKKWSQAYDALSASYQRFSSLASQEGQRSSSASKQVKAVQNMLTEQKKMYSQLADLRTKKLIDKSSVTNAENQLDALQNLPKFSQAYANQFAAAQKAVQRAVSGNEGSLSLKKIQSLQQQMSSWASKIDSKRQLEVVDQATLNQFDQLYQKTQSLTVGTQEWVNSVNALRSAYSNVNQASKTATALSNQEAQQKKMMENISAWETEMRRISKRNPNADQTYLQNFSGYTSQFREAQTLEEQTRLYEQAASARRKYKDAVSEQVTVEAQLNRTTAHSTHVNNLQSQISDLIRNTPGLSKNQTIYQQLLGLQNRAAAPDADFAALQNRFSDLRSQIKTLGLDTETLGQRLSRLFSDHMNTAIAMAGLHLIQSTFREIYQSVVDVDTAMTDLKKVSSGTTQEYADFFDTASSRAHDLGATMTDVIDATSEFSRLGYNLEESTNLADAALMYKNVSEYTNVTDAAQSIVSTMKAFDIEADDVQSIVDKFNEIGNSYAISSEGLGEAMQRSAASLALAGNSLDESLALVTGANEIVQDPDTVGTWAKTLTMYLRAAEVEAENAGIETEGMASSVSELRASILALTSNRVDIMKNDTEFKSTVQIMREIASVYDSLTDVDAAALLELISGKRQANTTAALIKNWDQVEKAIQTSMDSEGSAAKENAHYLDSIEGKQQQFAASFDELSTSILSSDLVKGVVDTGSGILGFFQFLIDNLGTVPGLIAPVIALLSKLKGLNPIGTRVDSNGRTVFDTVFSRMGSSRSAFIENDNIRIANDQEALRQYIASATRLRGTNLEQYFANSSSAVVDFARNLDNTRMSTDEAEAAVQRYGEQQVRLRSFTAQASSALKGFAASLGSMAILTVISLALEKLISFADSLHMSAEEAAQVTADVISTYNSSMSELSSNVDSITSLSDRFSELSKGVSSAGENISLTSSEYEEYKDIVQQLIDMNPALVQGYNAQGDAIIDQATAIEKSIALTRQHQIAAARESVYGGRDTNDGRKTNYEAAFIDFEAQLNDQKNELTQAATDAADLVNEIWANAQKSGAGEQAADQIFGTLGVGISDYSQVVSLIRDHQDEIAENLPMITQALAEQGLANTDAIAQSKQLSDAYAMEKLALDSTADSMRTLTQAIFESNDSYYDLKDNSKAFLDDFVRSISWEDIENMGVDNLMSTTQNILDTVSNDGNVRKSIDQMYELLANKDNMPADEFMQRGSELIESLESGIQDEDVDVGEIFNFDGIQTQLFELRNTIRENFIDAFDGLEIDENLVTSAFDKIDFGNLSIKQMQTFNKLLSQSGDNASQVASVLAQFATLDLLPESLDEFSSIFDEQVTAVEAAQDALTSYQGAVEDMMSEADIHESFVEIYDEFAKSVRRGQVNTDKARMQMELLIGDIVDLETARKWVKDNEGLFLTGLDEELGAQELPAIYDTLHEKYNEMTDAQREYVDSLMTIDWSSGSFLVADGDVEDLADAFGMSAASLGQALGVMESYSDQEFITPDTLKKQVDNMVSISNYLAENVDKDSQETANAWESLFGLVEEKIDFEKVASSMGLDATDMTVEEAMRLGDAFNILGQSLNSLPKYTQTVSGYIDALAKANSIEDTDSEAYKKAMAQVEEYEAKIREIPPEVLTRYGIEIPTQDEVDRQISDLKDRLSGSNIEIDSIVNAKVDGNYVASDIQNQIVQGDGIQFALHYIPVVNGEEISQEELKAYANEITKGAKTAQEVLERDANEENGGKGILVRVSAGVTLNQDNENSWDKVTENMISDLQEYQNMLDQHNLVLNLSQIKTQIAADGDGALSGVLATIDSINEAIGETAVTLQQAADGSWNLDISNLASLSDYFGEEQDKVAGIFNYIAEMSTEAGTPVDFTINKEPADEQLNGFMSDFNEAVEKLTQQYGINIDHSSVDSANQKVASLQSALQVLNNTKPTVTVSMAFDPLPEIISGSSTGSTNSSKSSKGQSIGGSGYSGITGEMSPLNSMASGGKSPGGRTLVGELGRELWISRDGKNKKIVGKDGMEVINMKPGDAIVPNNLTEQLIRGGMNSAAGGSGKGALDNWISDAKPSKDKSSSSSSKSSSSKSSSSKSSSSDDTYADWVEEQLEIMQHMIDVWDEKGGFEKFGDEILAKYSEMQKFVHDAAEHYRKLGYSETSKEIRDLQDKWFEYRNAIRDVYKDIYDTQKSSAEGSISILESQFEMIEQKIGVSTAALQENLDTPFSFSVSDDAFDLLYEQMKDNAEQQIDLQTQIMKAAHKEADRYRDMGYLDTSEEIQDLKQTYLSAQQAITELKQTIADKLVSQFDDFIDLADTFNRWDNLKTNKLDVLRRKLSQINQLLSDGLITLAQYKEYMVDVSESIYNEQKDAIDSIIDLTMDMLQQQQQDEIDAIQEQVDLYQQKVDLIKETIQLNNDEDDYQRDLEKKLREIAKLQAKIDQLSLDDSREAAAQRAELAEQLADLQEELAELQGDRGIEIQEDALDKENEKFQDASDEKIDILEDQYSSTQKLHDAAIKYIEENWSTLKDQLIQYNYQYGDSLEDEIINKWEIARQAVERYGLSVNAALQGIENENIGMSSDKSAILDIIQQMQQNSQKWLSDPSNRDQYSKANQSLGAQLSKYGINARYDNKTGKWFVGNTDTELYDLTKYPSIIDQLIGSKYPISDSGDGDNYLDDDYADLDENDAKFQARKEDILDVIEKMYRNQQLWLQTNDTNKRKELSDENDSLAVELSRLGLSYYHDHRAGTWHLGGSNGPLLYSAVNNPDLLDSYIRYHTGGIAGSLKPNEVIAILERGESIYTEEQNDQIKGIIELQQKLANALSGSSTSLPGIFDSIRSAGSIPTSEITQNSQVTFAPEVNISIDPTNKSNNQLIKDIRDSVLDSIRSAFSQSGIMSSRMQFRPI